MTRVREQLLQEGLTVILEVHQILSREQRAKAARLREQLHTLQDLSATDVLKEIKALRAARGGGNEKPLQAGGECNPHRPPQEVLVLEIGARCCDMDDCGLPFEPAWQQRLGPVYR